MTGSTPTSALPKGVHFVETADGIEEYVLDNGLRIVLRCYPLSSIIKFQVMYNYGSRNETSGKTGIAHFLEHNMFKGTSRFDPRQGNGSGIFTRAGGMNNANTSWDRTVYYEVVPSDRLPLVSAFEADRMRNLLFRDWRPERDVVLKELDERNDDPDKALLQAVLEAAFPDHPYGAPIIGRRQDVSKLTDRDLIEAYETYSWPNNATLIIVGGFNRDEVLATLAADFGPIPRSPKPIPQVVRPALGAGARRKQQRLEVRHPAASVQLMMAYHMPAGDHADVYALDVVSRILGGSSRKNSRLYESLVEPGLAHGCAAYTLLGLDPFAFVVSADVAPGIDPRRVEQEVARQLAVLADLGVREEELSRIKESNRNGTTLAGDDPQQMADLILNAEALGWTWRGIKRYDQLIDGVSPEDVRRVAAKYLCNAASTVGVLIPDDTRVPAAPDEQIVEQAPAELVPDAKAMVLPPPRPSRALAPQVVRQVLGNGLTLIVLPSPGTGTVAVSAVVFGAGGISCPREKPGIASLTASMLRNGSRRFGKQPLAETFERMALPFAVTADDYHARCDALVVAEHLPEFVEVLKDLLANPAFSQPDLLQEIGLRRARLKSLSKSTSACAQLALLGAIYPEGHPLQKPDLKQALAALEQIEVDDLLAFHSGYNPKSTILTVVGDVQPHAVLTLFQKHFGSWRGKKRPRISVPVAGDVTSMILWENMPGNNMVDIAIGRATKVSRHRPRDFFAAAIANHALGGGLESRLSRAVRQTNGLTYGISSSFGDASFGATPWAILVSTNPANANLTLSLVQKVVGRYRQDGISDREFADTVAHMAGAFPMRFLCSSTRIAAVLAQYESLGLGGDGLDGYIEALRSVSKDDVNKAIADNFDLSRCLAVLAGNIPS